MRIEDVRGRFPDNLRKAWEIDRILQPGPDGTVRLDLRAGYSATNRAMGAGSTRLGRRVPVLDALTEFDAHLGDAVVVEADLWGAQLGNQGLIQLLDTAWFAGFTSLNLGANKITKMGLEALSKHAVGAQLRLLGLSYNKVGTAFTKLSFPALESLHLTYAGVTGKALAALGKADLPALIELTLDGAEKATTPQGLGTAQERGKPILAVYKGSELAAFGGTPVAKRLKTLSLGHLEIGKGQAKVIGSRFDTVETLYLHGARMTPAALVELAGGKGLGALRVFDLEPPQSPAWELAPTCAAIEAVSAHFGPTLEHLRIARAPLGEAGATALVSHPLPALRRLDLSGCGLGDAGLATIVAAEPPLLDALIVPSNHLGPDALNALLASPLEARLTRLAWHWNRTSDGAGDAVCAALAAAALPAIERISVKSLGISDASAPALASAPWFSRIDVLHLADNKLSDTAALAFAEAAFEGRVLDLAQNGIEAAGIAALRERHGARVKLGGQDPTRLPPRFRGTIPGVPALRFEARDRVAVPRELPTPSEIRSAFEGSGHYFDRQPYAPDWVICMPKNAEGTYNVGAAEVATGRVAMPEPPIAASLLSIGFSPDYRWIVAKLFRDGAYVVDVENASTHRLGDVLTHKYGGAVFCGDRAVVLCCDTDGEWEGRLDVYGHDGEVWTREHSLGGFQEARNELVPLAGQRLLAVTGSKGFFLVAVRGGAVRCLGHIPQRKAKPFDLDGEFFVHFDARFYWACTNLDEVLDAAFAAGSSPTSIDLPESAWG